MAKLGETEAGRWRLARATLITGKFLVNDPVSIHPNRLCADLYDSFFFFFGTRKTDKLISGVSLMLKLNSSFEYRLIPGING
eukprot:SAG11_NODE_26000_length_351_cov_0.611111_1_plen_81_part_01